MAGSCVLCVDDQTLTVMDPRRRSSGSGNAAAGGGGKRGEEQHQQAHDFSFDRVFGPEATQDDVFNTVKPLVHATVDGFTTTVFAYGSTGSGKTHTISGTDEDPGVLPRAVKLLFERLESDMAAGSDKAFMVFLTFVEIYNNVFHNLLEGATIGSSGNNNNGTAAGGRHSKTPHNSARHSSDTGGTSTPPPPPPSTKIEVREHPSRGVFLSGGTGLRVPVSSAAAVAALVARGTKSRRTATTGLNDRSSRSHAILILEIEATHSPPSAAAAAARASGGDTHSIYSGVCGGALVDGVGGPGGARGLAMGMELGRRVGRRRSIVECVSIGKMQLIDLAGSERVSMSEVEGSSLVEAQNINLSLTLLGDVLSALSKYHRAATRSSSSAAAAAAAAASSGVGEGGSAAAAAAGAAAAAATGGGGGADKPFIPYRNSKLTYLLKDSLGGNCKTLMVCAVRAAPACFQQTMMSLRYAGRARDIKNVPHQVLEDGAGGGGGGRGGGGGGGGHGTSLRGTVDEIERLRTKLVETTAEFERLRGATAIGESEKKAMSDQLKSLAEKNRSEKRRMDELLEGVIHSQKGELEKRKAEYIDLQDTMDSHAETIEKQKERIKNLQTESEAAASAASTARDQAQELRQALHLAEKSSLQLRDEASTLRARGELLRIERDSATSRVSRLEEDGKEREAARKAEKEEMAEYRKAVKKMAKEREGLKAKADEAQECINRATAALAESKKDAEEALVVAAAREEALLSREVGAEARASAAEGKARQWEKKADELALTLSQKVDDAKEATRAKTEAERQRDQARAKQGTASSLRAELKRAKGELSTLTETLVLLRRQQSEADLGRDLLETKKSEVEAALAAETARRSDAEGRRQELERSTASLSRELEAVRASLSEASSGTAAAVERARKLAAERETAEERLERAVEKTAVLESSERFLKEEIAEIRRGAGTLEARLGESAAVGEALSAQLAAREKEAGELRESLARREEEMAKLGTDSQAAAGRAQKALRDAVEFHEQEAAGLRTRLELQAEQALRASEELESRHAADVGEARGVARELRGLLAAREAETAGSAREASGREKRLLDAHSRDLDELKAKFAEERRQIRDKQAREGGKEKMNGGGAYSIPPLIFPVVHAAERERSDTARVSAETSREEESLRLRDELREKLREVREALELSSGTAEGLREALGRRDGEVERLRQALEEQANEADHERERACQGLAEAAERRLRDAVAGAARDAAAEAEREAERVAASVAKTREGEQAAAAVAREREGDEKTAAAVAAAREAAAAAAAVTATAAAAAAQERERLLELSGREELESRLAEQKELLEAEFSEREAQAVEERRAALRAVEEKAERRAVEREKEMMEKADGARGAEAATTNKQLRALGRKVVHLESATKEAEEAYNRELDQLNAALLTIEQRAKEEEGRASAAVAARDRAVSAAARHKEAADQQLRVCRAEAERARALVQQVCTIQILGGCCAYRLVVPQNKNGCFCRENRTIEQQK
ncbi:unnamed protein product [Pylaiella littoralis]